MINRISQMCPLIIRYSLTVEYTELNLTLCAHTRRPPFLLFSGGMPRASYGDRHCITVIHNKAHVALDFTSRIIDFFVIRDGPQHQGRKNTQPAAGYTSVLNSCWTC